MFGKKPKLKLKGSKFWRARAEARRAEAAKVRDLLRPAEVLSRYRCFYELDGKTIGPVSFWLVHELIETEQIPRDTKIIAEGSDYWRTFAEWERRFFPSENR
jgi:hypothetical protein